jgi:hypothetical protein
MPTYIVRNEAGEPMSIGHVEGSLPNVLPPERKDPEY